VSGDTHVKYFTPGGGAFPERECSRSSRFDTEPKSMDPYNLVQIRPKRFELSNEYKHMGTGTDINAR